MVLIFGIVSARIQPHIGDVMTEKYKIYISEDTKKRLANDAELFEFTRPDGSVNLNGFLKELIVQYFDLHRCSNEELLDHLLQDLTLIRTLRPKDAAALADRIIHTYINNREPSSGKSTVITLTVSGASYNIIQIIENNLLKDTSLSGYLKEMFLSYLSMPRNKREEIIFRENYQTINEAIRNDRVLAFSSSATMGNTLVEPYMIATSKEEQFGYLLCRDPRSGKERSFRVSRLRNLFATSEPFIRNTYVEEELIRKSLRSPYSMQEEVHAIVRLTEHGKDMFRMIVKNRPILSSIEGDLYHFDWPILQLEDYFKRFGKDAVVISPRNLRTNLRNYYSHALDAYSPKKDAAKKDSKKDQKDN